MFYLILIITAISLIYAISGTYLFCDVIVPKIPQTIYVNYISNNFIQIGNFHNVFNSFLVLT